MDLPEELLVFRRGAVQYGVDMRCVRGLRPHRQPGGRDWGVALQLNVGDQQTVLEADEITPMARPEPGELQPETLDGPACPFPLMAQVQLQGRTVHLLDVQALVTRH